MAILHSFHPQPILFQIGPVAIHWYALFIVLGIIAGLFFVLRLSKHYGFTADDVYDLAFYLIIFSVLGARLYMILLFPDFYLSNPLEIFKVWNGGLAIHGTIFAAILTLFCYCRMKKQNFWVWGDILVVALALGQAIGRWGNYFNQEVYGAPTNVAWGIPIDLANRAAGFKDFEFFHPTFLYESILNLVLFFLLLSLHVYRIRKKGPGIMNQESGISPSPQPSPRVGEGEEERGKSKIGNWKLEIGNLSLVYLIGYSAIRIIMEQFRIDETLMVFGIRFPVLVSAGVIVVAVGLLVRRSRKRAV